ncbi:MAG: hypothetical protein WCG42_06350, partial [Parachlamydiaceae bacterium]
IYSIIFEKLSKSNLEKVLHLTLLNKCFDDFNKIFLSSNPQETRNESLRSDIVNYLIKSSISAKNLEKTEEYFQLQDQLKLSSTINDAYPILEMYAVEGNLSKIDLFLSKYYPKLKLTTSSGDTTPVQILRFVASKASKQTPPIKFSDLIKEINKGSYENLDYFAKFCGFIGDFETAKSLLNNYSKNQQTPQKTLTLLKFSFFNAAIKKIEKLKAEQGEQLPKELMKRKESLPAQEKKFTEEDVIKAIKEMFGNLQDNEKRGYADAYIDCLVAKGDIDEAQKFYNLYFTPKIIENCKLDCHELSCAVAAIQALCFIQTANSLPIPIVTGKGHHSTGEAPFKMKNFMTLFLKGQGFKVENDRKNQGMIWVSLEDEAYSTSETTRTPSPPPSSKEIEHSLSSILGRGAQRKFKDDLTDDEEEVDVSPNELKQRAERVTQEFLHLTPSMKSPEVRSNSLLSPGFDNNSSRSSKPSSPTYSSNETKQKTTFIVGQNFQEQGKSEPLTPSTLLSRKMSFLSPDLDDFLAQKENVTLQESGATLSPPNEANSFTSPSPEQLREMVNIDYPRLSVDSTEETVSIESEKTKEEQPLGLDVTPQDDFLSRAPSPPNTELERSSSVSIPLSDVENSNKPSPLNLTALKVMAFSIALLTLAKIALTFNKQNEDHA